MPLRLTVSAKPGRKTSSIEVRAGTIVVAVRERAIDGRANAAIIDAIAQWLGISRSNVVIVHGSAGRQKFVDVAGIDATALGAKIAERRKAKTALTFS
jgi:uncharacterized protein YggU (UPF0235/DUF167 family)